MSWAARICPLAQQQRYEVSALNSTSYHIGEPQELFAEDEIRQEGEYWVANDAKFQSQRWEEKIAKASRARVRYFELRNIRKATIIKDITHIEFKNLSSLYLQNNQIVSVEPLVTLKAPQLINLDLRNNLITQIRALRKCRTLDHLFISGNRILDYSPLGAIWFYKCIQKGYVTSYFGNSYLQTDDLRPFFKAEPLRVLAHLHQDQRQFISVEGGLIKRALSGK